jgi:hypothetical protein
MSDQWHVFYRTTGMQESKARGFIRADFLADTAEEALGLLLKSKLNVLHARVYPGAAALAVEVEWDTPNIVIKHEPHTTFDLDVSFESEVTE